MKTTASPQPSPILFSFIKPVLVVALLCLFSTVSRADFSGSDTLASGSANWTIVPQFTSGNGQLLFQNSRAEFIVGSPVAGDNVISQRWNLNTGSYSQDWSVQVELHLGMISLPTPLGSGSSSSFANLNLVIASAKNITNAFSIAIDRYCVAGGAYYADIEAGTMNQIDHTIFDSATNAKLQISYNSLRKTLTASYNAGGGWQTVDVINIASGANKWGMGAKDGFYAVLASNSGNDSGGTAAAIASGQAYYSNFAIQSGTIANGNYSTDFGGIWNLSGHYSGTVYTGTNSHGLGLDFSLNQTDSGTLSGDGTFHHSDGSGTTLDGPLKVSGAIKATGAIPVVTLTFSGSGSGTVAASGTGGGTDPASVIATVKTIFNIDGDGGNLVVTGGTLKDKVTDKATRKTMSESKKLHTGDTFDLPADVTGDCTLDLTVLPAASNKYAGSAVVKTSNGRQATLNVSGGYSTKTASSAITLKGTAGTVNMTIDTTGTNMQVQSAKGKLYGQSISYTAP